MALETLEPNPVWTADAHEETVETLAAHDDLVYRVWGGDWCKDCRSQLPDFGAALDAAEISEERIHHYEVDQDKQGPGVDAYDIEYIPTVVVERFVSREESAGELEIDESAREYQEIARFVEEEPVPIAVYLANRIQETLED